uniref:Uncharacterized protein n=1 Tax=Anopheles coluzzii TaxID=1518534 RepID=A0A8W7PRX2_ANOCL
MNRGGPFTISTKLSGTSTGSSRCGPTSYSGGPRSPDDDGDGLRLVLSEPRSKSPPPTPPPTVLWWWCLPCSGPNPFSDGSNSLVTEPSDDGALLEPPPPTPPPLIIPFFTYSWLLLSSEDRCRSLYESSGSSSSDTPPPP